MESLTEEILWLESKTVLGLLRGKGAELSVQDQFAVWQARRSIGPRGADMQPS